MQSSDVGGLGDRLRAWFPDREFFMRSQGQVRFIKVSSRVQMIAAGVVVALTAAWLLTMAVMVVLQFVAARDRLSLLDREAQVAKSESRVADYRENLSGVTADLQRRQDFIIEMVETHVGDLPTDMKPGETVSNSSTEAAETIRKVSAEIPEAAGLARIEARQLAFVEALTRAAPHEVPPRRRVDGRGRSRVRRPHDRPDRADARPARHSGRRLAACRPRRRVRRGMPEEFLRSLPPEPRARESGTISPIFAPGRPRPGAARPMSSRGSNPRRRA